jgi:hypothetical protein
MAWNGTGTFNRIYSWVADKAAAIDITGSRMRQTALRPSRCRQLPFAGSMTLLTMGTQSGAMRKPPDNCPLCPLCPRATPPERDTLRTTSCRMLQHEGVDGIGSARASGFFASACRRQPIGFNQHLRRRMYQPSRIQTGQAYRAL